MTFHQYCMQHVCYRAIVQSFPSEGRYLLALRARYAAGNLNPLHPYAVKMRRLEWLTKQLRECYDARRDGFKDRLFCFNDCTTCLISR